MTRTTLNGIAILTAAVGFAAATLAASAQPPAQTEASRLKELETKAGAISSHYHPDTQFIVDTKRPITEVTSSHAPGEYATPAELGAKSPADVLKVFQAMANRDLQAAQQFNKAVNTPKR